MGVESPGSRSRPSWLNAVREWGQGHQAPSEHTAKVRSLISFQVHWEPLDDTERSSEMAKHKFSNIF